MEKLIATSALIAGLLLWSFSGPATGERAEKPEPAVQVETSVTNLATAVVTATDTLPPDAPKAQKQVEKIVRQDDNERIEITLEDGELNTLEINGEKIPPSEFDQYRDRVEGILAELPPPPPAPPAGMDIPAPPAPPAPPSGEEMPEPPAPPVFYEIQVQGLDAEEKELSGEPQWFEGKEEVRIRSMHRMPGKKTTEIRTEKDDNGNTVLLISDPEGGKPIRVVVDEQGNSVQVDGNELQEGETAIVIDETKPAKGNYLFRRSGEDGAVVLEREGLRLAEIQAKAEARAKEAEERMRLREKEIEGHVQGLRKKAELIRKNLEAHRRALKNDRHMDAHQKALEKGLRYEVENMVIRDGDGKMLFSSRGNPNLKEVISRQLLSDGLIENADNFDFSLNTSKLKVNGKKQSDELHRKYKKLVETSLDIEELSGKDQIEIEAKCKNINTKVQLSGS